MKNAILILFLLASGILPSQKFSDSLILKNRSSDVLDMNETFLSTGPVQVTNVDEELIKIQYYILMDLIDYEKITDKSIFDKITRSEINSAARKVKSKYTFKPKKVSFYIRDGNIYTMLEYTAENDYGAEKSSSYNGSEYKLNGEFIRNKMQDELDKLYSR